MLFSLLIFDEPDTASLRDIHRKAHLDSLKKFDDQTLFAGPFTTDDESADMDTARAFIAGEPYNRAGCFENVTFHRWRFGRVFDRFKV